jgi:predicted metal-dependent hydrolase
VQLRLPLADDTPNHPAAVIFVRHRRARRYILRVLSDGTLRVTLPRWGVKRDAEAFVAASREWIARQRARRSAAPSAASRWPHGSRILLDGQLQELRVERHLAGLQVWCGDILVAAPSRASRVRFGEAGCIDVEDLRPTVAAWMRARALRELPALLLTLAKVHGIHVPRISIRNQRSCWGACSARGTITLNWRLIQAPPFVREYVLLHELMHLRELNHSRRFWRLIAGCCPRHAEARLWLRREGKSLWTESD